MDGRILHRRDCACGKAVAVNGRAVEMLLLEAWTEVKSREAGQLQGLSGRQAELKMQAPGFPCLRKRAPSFVLVSSSSSKQHQQTGHRCRLVLFVDADPVTCTTAAPDPKPVGPSFTTHASAWRSVGRRPI
jgi:hypothetical protein